MFGEVSVDRRWVIRDVVGQTDRGGVSEREGGLGDERRVAEVGVGC
jgi:hypothetical protein